MRSTPASAAASAVDARIVSTEVRIPSACSAAMTGRTRSASTSAGTRVAPGRVDSAPTSIMSAPSRTSSCAWAIASSAASQRPPSENESSVTLTMPITVVRPGAVRSATLTMASSLSGS